MNTKESRMTRKRTTPAMPSIKGMLETTDGRTTCLIIAALVIVGVVSGVLRLRFGEFYGVKLVALAPIVYYIHAASRPYVTSKRKGQR
jgi:hypothetical protein